MPYTLSRSLVALFIGVILTSIFPSICFVVGPICMLFYNTSLTVCLWAALGSGLLLDAIELSPRFGFLGLVFLLAARLLFGARLYFFKDSFITLPVMTYLFSLLAKCIELPIALFFDISIPKTNLEALFIQPFVDAIAAVCVFSLPSFLWQQYRQKIKRRRYSDDT